MHKAIKTVLIVIAILFAVRAANDFYSFVKGRGKDIKALIKHAVIGKTFRAKMTLKIAKHQCDARVWNDLVQACDRYISLYRKIETNGFNAIRGFSEQGEATYKALAAARSAGASVHVGRHVSSGSSYRASWRDKERRHREDVDVWSKVARHAERYMRIYRRVDRRDRVTDDMLDRLARQSDVLMQALTEAREWARLDKEETSSSLQDSSWAGDVSTEYIYIKFVINKDPKCKSDIWNEIADIAHRDDVIRAICKIVALVGDKKRVAQYMLKFTKS